MDSNLEFRAVELGLVKIAPPGEFFPSRGGGFQNYIVDSRGAGANLELRTLLLKGLETTVESFKPVEAYAGVARGGTIWAAWLAERSGVPYATVLPDGPRGVGLRRAVEGDVSGLRVAVVDNVVNSGATTRAAVLELERAGAIVIGVVAFTIHADARVGIPTRPVFNTTQLLKIAKLEENYNAYHEI